jgi:hypothetical protein
MLPTPAKTPRKRALQSEASLNATVRVLFPARSATIEDAVPTPRKMRKTKGLFSLESSARDEGAPSEKIAIYTDSKERIPTHDEDDENPFVTKKGKAKAVPQKVINGDAQVPNTTEAADRDEGMVYLFRGRKMFRKFHDDPLTDASDDDRDLPIDEKLLRRQAGPAARRPLTRSSVKPRLLFQAEIEQRNRENGIDEDDEEAETEIEAPVATPSRRKGKDPVPIVAPALEASPPPTVRKPRRGTLFTLSEHCASAHDPTEISFGSWSRVKSAHSSGGHARETKKRSGEPLERDVDKRARSEHSASSMFLDSF